MSRIRRIIKKRNQKSKKVVIAISKKAEQLVKDNDIDINLVIGTGKNGGIITADVVKYIKSLEE